MENNFTPEEVAALREELAATRLELEKAKQEKITVQQPQDAKERIIETIIDKASPFIMQYMSISHESSKYETDKQVELEKEEVKIINKLDTKEKVFKGLMLSLCIVALIFSSMYLPKAEVVIPVLTLIIGLLFKTNTLTDFFSHVKGKFVKTGDE